MQLHVWIAREILYKTLYEHFELHLFSKTKFRYNKDTLIIRFPGDAFLEFDFNIETSYYKTKYIIGKRVKISTTLRLPNRD
jgi:hypothetical protein